MPSIKFIIFLFILSSYSVSVYAKPTNINQVVNQIEASSEDISTAENSGENLSLQNSSRSSSTPDSYDFLNLESHYWQLRKEKKGVKVYTLNVDGLPYKAYRAEMIVEGSMSPYLAVIQDLDNYQKWMHTNIQSKILEQVSGHEFHAYMVHHQRNAFGIKPRDYYTKITMKKNSKDLSVMVIWEPLEKPKTEGRIRIKRFRNVTHLTPIPDSEKFKITISGYSDPGGKIPPFLVNLFTTELPYKNMIEFRRTARQPEYQQKKVSYFNNDM